MKIENITTAKLSIFIITTIIMNEIQAMVRPYYKYEVAQFYKISRKKLIHWIKTFENFYDKLAETGYKENQHILTLKQVEIIFNFLGHPPPYSNEVFKKTGKVPVIPYTKSDLSQMYGIGAKTLITQINSIPDDEIYKQIMDGNDQFVYSLQKTKKIFKKKEVKLIFYWLGHPYTYEKISN